jgi:hypothetical protein
VVIRKKNPYAIVVENIFDKEKRKIIHHWAKQHGLMSVADNVQTLGGLDDKVKCRRCGDIAPVIVRDDGGREQHADYWAVFEDSDMYSEDEFIPCKWTDRRKHDFPYQNVLGRVIIWHPDHQPRLTKQAKNRFVWYQKNKCIVFAMICLQTLQLPRDLIYIIITYSYCVKMWRVTQ